MDNSLKSYFKHYKSVYGLITTLLCSIPVISSIFSDEVERYLFPPLGNFDTIGRICTVILVLLVTMIVYFAKDLPIVQNKPRRFSLLIKMVLICIGFYLVFFILNLCFVQTITILDENKTVMNASVGYERQQWAKDSLKGSTDYEVLTKKRGPYEKEIQKVWTMSSLVVVRTGLLLCYIAFFVVAVSISSLLILFDYMDSVLKAEPNSTTEKKISDDETE